MIAIDLFLSQLSDDLLNIVDSHVRPEIVLFLAPDLVSCHEFGQFLLKQLFGLFPAELVRIRLADALTLNLIQEEQTLNDVWHLEYSESFDISQDFLPVFLLLEPLRFNSQCSLVIVNVFQNGVILEHLSVKVIDVKL